MIYTLNVEIKSYFDDLFYQQIYENNCNIFGNKTKSNKTKEMYISNYFGGTPGYPKFN